MPRAVGAEESTLAPRCWTLFLLLVPALLQSAATIGIGDLGLKPKAVCLCDFVAPFASLAYVSCCVHRTCLRSLDRGIENKAQPPI